MSIVSLFRYDGRVLASKPLLTVLQQIRKGTFRREVELLRDYYEHQRDFMFDQQKRLLPRVAVAGHFKLMRDLAELVSYSGCFFLEIPFLTLQDRVLFRLMAREDPYVFACFKNAIGFGLILIVRVEVSREQHKRAFQQLRRYYRKQFGSDRVMATGQDLDAQFMVSFDEGLYLNMEALSFPFEY